MVQDLPAAELPQTMEEDRRLSASILRYGERKLV